MSGRVTITLGRTGQVVKRDVPDSEGTSSDRGGHRTKRSVKDRLGEENNTWNKRQRREDSKWSRGGADMNNSRQNIPNHRIGQNDLRLKLMHKNLSKHMDTRDKDQIDRRSNERYSQVNQGHLQFNARSSIGASRSPTHIRSIPPRRSDEDFLQMDSLGKSQNSWNSDGPRHRSPDRLVGAPRPLSPLRRHDVVPSIRSMEPPLQTTYMPRNAIDSSRHVPFMDKASANVQAPKNVMLPPGHPPSSIPPKSSFTFEEPLTVVSLLNALGLGKYAILFQAEEVDMAALKQMSDNDLKDLGIPMGPRKKILLAVGPRSKHA